MKYIPELTQLVHENPIIKQIMGSPQEFDGTRILNRFLEHHKFSLGRRHALRLQ
jgi:hypothetical protein